MNISIDVEEGIFQIQEIELKDGKTYFHACGPLDFEIELSYVQYGKTEDQVGAVVTSILKAYRKHRREILGTSED